MADLAIAYAASVGIEMLEKYHCSIKQFLPAGLYLLAAAALIYSVYGSLWISLDGIKALQIENLLFTWQVLFAFVSVPLLTIGAFLSFGNRQRGAKVAFWGAMFGWVYVLLIACAGFLIMSVLAFILPPGCLWITLPGALILAATIYSRRVQRQERSDDFSRPNH